MGRMQEQDIRGEDWDVLIVLDAARYDVFADLCDGYLDGELEKRRSRGSATPEWAAKTFTEPHDITYFSANPFINSTGVPLKDMPQGGAYGYDWTAEEHFSDVIDIWRTEWDSTQGTVPPERMNRAVRERMPLDDRTIIHYLQPHAPFINESGGGTRRLRAAIKKRLWKELAGRNTVFHDAVAGVWNRLRHTRLVSKLVFLLELSPSGVLETTYRGAAATLMERYRSNLRRSLRAVADLADDLDGDIVVTADHGEAFGEYGVWKHNGQTHIPPLVHVPWMRLA